MTDDIEPGLPVRERPSAERKEPTYEMRFTRQQGLIAGYKYLRKRLYGIDRRFIGFREFSAAAAEDYEDANDQMLILHEGNRVYGGACLRISIPKHPVILDLEQDILPPGGEYYFSLPKHLPELELDKYAYAEFNRIVLHPALRKGEATRRMFQAVLDRCIRYRVRYLFGIGDKVRTRLYKQIYNNFGLPAIPNGVDIPMREQYEGVKMYLIYGDMKRFHAVPGDPDATGLLEPCEDYQFSDRLPAA